MAKEVRVGLVGCGTVGTGVARILLTEADLIEKKAGVRPVLVKVATRDWSKPRPFTVPERLRTTDWREVVESAEVVVELVGGTGVAAEVVKAALRAGKPVVTANKHLLAEHGRELAALAKEAGTVLLFEGAVGGGIPLVKVLKESLVSNEVEEILGILNGTTNFILTKMEEENLPFEEALRQAQEKGYAEADPTFDVEGVDAAHKIAILANLAFGGFVDFSRVFVEGIRGVELLDLRLGRELGYKLKLLAVAKRRPDGKVEVRVHPTFVPLSNPLSTVDGVYNGVLFKSNYLGRLKLQGAGAGAMPTATAVVQDVVQAAKWLAECGRAADLTPLGWDDGELEVADDFYTRYYLRLAVEDKPGVLYQIAKILAEEDISIAGVLQQEWILKFLPDRSEVVPLIILTHKAYESQIKRAISRIERLPFVRSAPVLIRVEEERF
ncbi:MAG: homoserine dehydrogenase [Aquificae bacterium]|nr:homoserine dehydrogenase [Aquificota bacterium]